MTVATTDKPADQATLAANDNRTWLPLRYFNLYRLLLSGLFSTLYFSGNGPKLFGENNPGLFAATSLIYLACVLAGGCCFRISFMDARRQVLSA